MASAVIFDSDSVVIHDRLPLDRFPRMTEKEQDVLHTGLQRQKVVRFRARNHKKQRVSPLMTHPCDNPTL